MFKVNSVTKRYFLWCTRNSRSLISLMFFLLPCSDCPLVHFLANSLYSVHCIDKRIRTDSCALALADSCEGSSKGFRTVLSNYLSTVYLYICKYTYTHLNIHFYFYRNTFILFLYIYFIFICLLFMYVCM